MRVQTNLGEFEGIQSRLETCAQLVGGKGKLATLAEIKSRTFSGYLAGEYLPKLEALYAISRVSGASVDWLLTGEGSMHRADRNTISTNAARERARDAAIYLMAMAETFERRHKRKPTDEEIEQLFDAGWGAARDAGQDE